MAMTGAASVFWFKVNSHFTPSSPPRRQQLRSTFSALTILTLIFSKIKDVKNNRLIGKFLNSDYDRVLRGVSYWLSGDRRAHNLFLLRESINRLLMMCARQYDSVSSRKGTGIVVCALNFQNDSAAISVAVTMAFGYVTADCMLSLYEVCPAMQNGRQDAANCTSCSGQFRVLIATLLVIRFS